MTRTRPSSTVHHYGKSAAPVCWSLVGYASGFASACLGKEIYFREIGCAGQGERHVLGRSDGTPSSWGDASSKRSAQTFRRPDLGQEVERLRDAVGTAAQGARPARAAARAA